VIGDRRERYGRQFASDDASRKAAFALELEKQLSAEAKKLHLQIDTGR
jgi:hypothetical protein